MMKNEDVLSLLESINDIVLGHGYAPVVTIKDGNGDVAYSGPTIFLPTDQTFRSFGVVKAADAQPTQIGLEGEFYPTYAFTDATGVVPVRANWLPYDHVINDGR